LAEKKGRREEKRKLLHRDSLERGSNIQQELQDIQFANQGAVLKVTHEILSK